MQQYSILDGYAQERSKVSLGYYPENIVKFSYHPDAMSDLGGNVMNMILKAYALVQCNSKKLHWFSSYDDVSIELCLLN